MSLAGRLAGLAVVVLVSILAGCASGPNGIAPWESRLRGTTLALLGEVHDNPRNHAQRAAILRRAVEAGWRPAIVMEQFDVDRQPDIDRSRTEHPHDAQALIDRAAGARSGWDWALYKPLVELALQFDLPLAAGNLPRSQTMRLVRENADAVLGAARAAELGLHRALDTAWQAAQEREIDAGHCGTLPRALWPGMVRAQSARDAVMAQVLKQHADRGAVLIAGNGHVRRDIGVPRWLSTAGMWSVGFVEADTAPPGPDQFDAVVVTTGVDRGDPCAPLRKSVPPPKPPDAA
ncbi:MAG TPA: ChaN family lipoprotein [Albitalea sp.]|nr:ChaN family lipoprotein [Albitalea sp.]